CTWPSPTTCPSGRRTRVSRSRWSNTWTGSRTRRSASTTSSAGWLSTTSPTTRSVSSSAATRCAYWSRPGPDHTRHAHVGGPARRPALLDQPFQLVTEQAVHGVGADRDPHAGLPRDPGGLAPMDPVLAQLGHDGGRSRIALLDP